MAYKMVAHAAKFKRDNLKGARMHNERLTKQHSNKDIDVTRSYLNYSLVDRRPESYAKQVNRLLNSDRKPRKDAVYDVEFVFGSDGKYMLSLDAKQQRKYFQTCMDYVADKWGKDRILYADVHLDETSPHMHMGAAPIDHDGHLAAKNLFDRNFLLTMQAELPARLAAAGFDIERGNPGGVHTTKKQWQKVTKEANEQVISQLVANFPNDRHFLSDKNGQPLYETKWGMKFRQTSHAWGTPEGQKELRERSLDDNVTELTRMTNKRVRTADKAVHEANAEKEQAKAQKTANDQYLATESARLHTAGIELDSRLSDVREREKKLEERKAKLAADAARVTRQKQEMNAVVAVGLPYVMGTDDKGHLVADLYKSASYIGDTGEMFNSDGSIMTRFDALVDGKMTIAGKTGAEYLFSHLQDVPVSQRARMQQDVNQAREKSRQTTETATAEPKDDGPEL